MNTDMTLPSKVLQSQFELYDEHKTESVSAQMQTDFLAHGLIVAGLGLILPRGAGGEFFEELPICRLPTARNWLFGIANQRGNIVPILDLAKVFDLNSDQQGIKHKYFIIGQGEGAVGIVIDGSPVRVGLSVNDRLSTFPPLPVQLQSFTNSCYEKDGRIWVDWDVEEFFTFVTQNIQDS